MVSGTPPRVDDEVFIRTVAADLLADQGYETLEAEEGAEAIAVLDHHPEVTLLLTDINMPGEPDGLLLAGWARDRRPELAIIVTSGRVTPDAGEMSARSRFVSKPYSSSQLLKAVARS